MMFAIWLLSLKYTSHKIAKLFLSWLPACFVARLCFFYTHGYLHMNTHAYTMTDTFRSFIRYKKKIFFIRFLPFQASRCGAKISKFRNINHVRSFFPNLQFFWMKELIFRKKFPFTFLGFSDSHHHIKEAVQDIRNFYNAPVVLIACCSCQKSKSRTAYHFIYQFGFYFMQTKISLLAILNSISIIYRLNNNQAALFHAILYENNIDSWVLSVQKHQLPIFGDESPSYSRLCFDIFDGLFRLLLYCVHKIRENS